MDKKLFLKAYGFSARHKQAALFAAGITRASSWIFFVLYGIVILNFAIERDAKIIRAVIIPAVAVLFNLLARRLIKRKRPFDELGLDTFAPHGSAYSFPSNHTVSSVIIAMTWIFAGSPAGFAVMAAAAVTGISRVFTGLHYPADVAVGFFVGLFFGIAGFFL